MKRLCVIILLAATVSFTACGSSEASKTDYAKTTVIKDTTELNSEIQKFLTGTAPSELSLFNDEIELNQSDKISYDDEIKKYSIGEINIVESLNGTTYTSRDAHYYELGNDIYRFQLDYNGNVVSYVHYQKVGK